MRPLAIDLFCGLGGWTGGLLAEGYRVVGFDMERHRYPRTIRPDDNEAQKSPAGGNRRNAQGQSVFKERACQIRDTMKHAEVIEGQWVQYPAQLVIQDVLTLHGSQFKDAALIVASPPCQAYSYMAMPWSRAKQIEREYLSGVRDVAELTALFDACFRIQREACEAAGRHIPMVVENVRGAQKWVGRSRWAFGSVHLWGDVPALMPIPRRELKGFGGTWFHNAELGTTNPNRSRTTVNPTEGAKMPTGSAQRSEKSRSAALQHYDHMRTALTNRAEGIKSGGDWFNDSQPSISRLTRSKSPARKMASAMIAKIPFVLSSHIARSWHP